MYLKPIDFVSIIYFLVISLLVSIFHKQVQHWQWYLIVQVCYLMVILLLIWGENRLPHSRTLKFFRYNYPLMASAFVYSAIAGYVLIFYGHFLDGLVNTFEKNLLGVYPNLWLEKFISRPLTEFLMFAYFSYYFYIIFPALILFLQKRYQDLERLVFNLTLAFYVSYLGFLFLPVEGPFYALKNLFTIPQLEGYVFTPLQKFIMAHGDPAGTCFPSSHVAVAWVALLSIKRFFGAKPFWIVLPFTISLTIGVVYNRYHYLTDAIAGLFTAWFCYQASVWIYQSLFSSQTKI